MRTLFWLLLLGNAILFAVMRQGGVSWGEPPYQPQPPLNEDKIRLLAAPQNATPQSAAPQSSAPQSSAPPNAVVPNAVAPNSAAQSSSTQNSSIKTPPVASVAGSGGASLPAVAFKPVPGDVPAVTPISPAPVVTAPASAAAKTAARPALAAAKQTSPVCLEWGDFSGADLTRATDFLSTMKLGEKLSQRQVQYDKGYWVYIPPLKSKAAANRKVTQLKKLGVKEYFIVQDAGAFRYAISLGVFKTKEAARNYLGELNAKGLRSTKVGERASKLKTTMFLLNDTDKSVAAKLAAAKKDFPGSELKNIPCALTK